MEVLAHECTLLGRQCLELLPALPQRLALLGRERVPVREAVACLGLLVRSHAKPALGAARERLLALRGQRIPLATEATAEELLLLRRQALPADRSTRGRRRR